MGKAWPKGKTASLANTPLSRLPTPPIAPTTVSLTPAANSGRSLAPNAGEPGSVGG
ncbi:hypothetical protein SAMN04487818_10165 [Actinokineospora terrae]|uniref:Uncharacterized protein n=1 Tax=Actinokineospora terrae TaxID=155974 RepID=A0A1H9K8Y3_9PSEU|nr:hypothetical protein SAMN04487818_10165 [Actinokineospora terrae]